MPATTVTLRSESASSSASLTVLAQTLRVLPGSSSRVSVSERTPKASPPEIRKLTARAAAGSGLAAIVNPTPVAPSVTEAACPARRVTVTAGVRALITARSVSAAASLPERSWIGLFVGAA